MDRALRLLNLTALVAIAGILAAQAVSPPAPAPRSAAAPPSPASPASPEVHVHVWPTPEVPPGEDTDSSHRGGDQGRIDLADAPGLLDVWEGLVASPSRPSLAVHDDHVLWLTLDDGRSWARHDLPERIARLVASDDGSFHAMLRTEPPVLWRLGPDGKRTAHRSPLAPVTLEWMAAGRGNLFLFGLRERKGAPGEKELALLRSADGGASFADVPPPPHGNFGNEARVEADGTLAVMYGQEASCGGGGQYHLYLPPSDTEWRTLSWPLDSPGSFWLGAEGWAYGLGRCAPEGVTVDQGVSRLCAVPPDENLPPVPGPIVPEGAFAGVATGGRTTYAVVGRNLYSVAGGAFRRVANDVPDTVRSHLGVDAKGRFVALGGGRVVRRTGRTWEVLLPH